MAIFDPVEQRLCVRIVYDGAAGAGKTTNLKALCSLFATQRTIELFTAGELDGRTLYFDWAQILAGSICGFPLMCQIISVPGQTVLTPRRRHLLSTADVVVLVCDSDPLGVERAREGLRLVDEVGGGQGLPIIVQANKQDRAQALSGTDLLAALGREATVIEAIASEGVGVIDTFVSAVRCISRVLQARSERGELAIEVGRAPVAQELLARLKQEALEPEWAAEMCLEEAQAAFLIAGGFDTVRAPAPLAAAESSSASTFPSVPRVDVESGFVWPAHMGRAWLDKLAVAGARDESILVDDEGAFELVVAGRRLRTSRSLRFEDRERARHALVRAARERTQLDHGIASETVLVLQEARDGALWLWTITWEATRLPALMAAASDADGAWSTFSTRTSHRADGAAAAHLDHRYQARAARSSVSHSCAPRR